MRTLLPLFAALVLASCTKEDPVAPTPNPLQSEPYYYVEAHVRTPATERLDMQVRLNGVLQDAAADMISWKTAKFWAVPGDTVEVRFRVRMVGSKEPGAVVDAGPGCFRFEAWRVTARTANELVCSTTGTWATHTYVLQ
jgi:hypothetical protein